MKIERVRKIAGREEIDYQFLLSILSDYSHPRGKIFEWLKSGDLVRVKKGLYVFGKNIALASYSIEVLANLIYGPSAISLNYALSYYGLIPEKVVTVTSITPKRNKSFSTPVGEFNYQYLSQTKYPVGIELVQNPNKNYFLIASPEKALCDYIHLNDRKITLDSSDEIHAYLLQDLRIDETALRSLKISKLAKISQVYQDARLNSFLKFFKKWK